MRQRQQHERDVTLAWYTVGIWVAAHKPKGKLQMPKLTELLDATRERKPKDVETEALFMANSLGIKMRRWKAKVKA